MKNFDRDPCPYRILDDLGGGFAIGLVGSSMFHAAKSIYTNKAGNRIWAAKEAIRSKSLVTAGNFGSWAFMYSSFDCLLIAARKKEDPLNSIVSAGLSGALLSARNGARSAVVSGAIGAGMLALIEGLNIALNHMVARTMRDQEASQYAQSQNVGGMDYASAQGQGK